MKLKQKSIQATLALALALALLTSVAPIGRPAEAAGTVSGYAIPDTSAPLSQVVDPAAIRPGPGSVPASSVHSGTSPGERGPAGGHARSAGRVRRREVRRSVRAGDPAERQAGTGGQPDREVPGRRP